MTKTHKEMTGNAMKYANNIQRDNGPGVVTPRPGAGQKLTRPNGRPE